MTTRATEVAEEDAVDVDQDEVVAVERVDVAVVEVIIATAVAEEVGDRHLRARVASLIMPMEENRKRQLLRLKNHQSHPAKNKPVVNLGGLGTPVLV